MGTDMQNPLIPECGAVQVESPTKAVIPVVSAVGGGQAAGIVPNGGMDPPSESASTVEGAAGSEAAKGAVKESVVEGGTVVTPVTSGECEAQASHGLENMAPDYVVMADNRGGGSAGGDDPGSGRRSAGSLPAGGPGHFRYHFRDRKRQLRHGSSVFWRNLCCTALGVG